MVLEDAAFSSPSAPESDKDQYSGDQNPTILSNRSPSSWPVTRPNGLPPIYLNMSNLPMPWFPLDQALCDASTRRRLAEAMQKASDEYYRVIGRPLEQREGDAIVFHMATGMRYASYGMPLGIFASLLLAARPNAWKTFRFPGWTPGEKFNGNKFLFFKGRIARAAWHFLRFNAYVPLGVLAGQACVASFGASVAKVGSLNDPRLKDVNEAVQKAAAKRRVAKGLPIDDRTEGKRGNESFEMARQRTWAQSAGPRTRSAGQEVVDDMSPTGGSFREDFEGGDVAMLSDSQIQQLQQRSQDTAEDMSSSTPRPAQKVSQSSSSSGSAWERLRQQAGQQQTPQSSRQQQQQSALNSPLPDSGDDDDAFGLSDGSTNPQGLSPGRHQNTRQSRLDGQSSTSQPSRSDAQREFDAQLERERQVQSFEEKSGRW